MQKNLDDALWFAGLGGVAGAIAAAWGVGEAGVLGGGAANFKFMVMALVGLDYLDYPSWAVAQGWRSWVFFGLPTLSALAGAVGGWRLTPSRKPVFSDVVEDAAQLKALARPFDPRKYIDLRKGLFLGLDAARKPIYVPFSTWSKNHKDILGESGVGKSSFAGVTLAQVAASGQCAVAFDPKNDANLLGVLAEAGKTWGNFPVNVIDLRPEADFPQVNPFGGCSQEQIEELLGVALELGKTGNSAVDFYRGNDREAASVIAGKNPANILEAVTQSQGDERVTENANIWRELRQVARVRAFHTNGGLNLAEVLARPGVLYVIGSTTRLEVVAAQKMLLQRALQIIDGRPDKTVPIAIFADELKYLLSPAMLRAAGVIRDRNCHLTFAHQSLGDLEDCPGLDPKAVRGAIWGNAGIKIIYRVTESQTTRELEAIAGESRTREVSASKKKYDSDSAGATVREGTKKHMPSHIFSHLPKPTGGEASVGVVFGLGPAFFLSTRWLPAGEAPKPVRAPGISPAVTGNTLGALPETPAPNDLDDLLR